MEISYALQLSYYFNLLYQGLSGLIKEVLHSWIIIVLSSFKERLNACRLIIIIKLNHQVQGNKQLIASPQGWKENYLIRRASGKRIHLTLHPIKG